MTEQFKLTQKEIERMEETINDFIEDPRKPFYCGSEIGIRKIELDGRMYGINFAIDLIDEDEDD